MRVILCIDKRGGMMFNKRRVTYDRIVSQDILRVAAKSRLLIAPYSEKLFAPYSTSYVVSDDPLAMAKDDDYVFIEGADIEPHIKSIDTLIIYNWNVAYPFDVKFKVIPKDIGLTLCESTNFSGNSHDIVTREIYRRIDC